jgi:hypothetical protein
MTTGQQPLPPDLRDGQYGSWEGEMATRFPGAVRDAVAVCAGLIAT